MPGTSQTRIRRTWCLAVLAATVALTGQSHAGDAGISIKASTLGAGLELDYALTDRFSIRLQGNSFAYDDTFEEDDIDYSGEIDFSTLGLLLDWHTFGGSFRLTAGFFSNGNELNGVASGEGDYEIGDRIYRSSPSDPVRARLAAELGSSTAPYFGFGWGNSPKNDRGLMFSFDIGVLASGSPEVTLDVSGTATDLITGFSVDMAIDPTVQAEVEREIAALEDDISEFDPYPVVSLGIGFRF